MAEEAGKAPTLVRRGGALDHDGGPKHSVAKAISNLLLFSLLVKASSAWHLLPQGPVIRDGAVQNYPGREHT